MIGHFSWSDLRGNSDLTEEEYNDIQKRLKALRAKREPKKPVCACGGEKAKTTHSHWCPIHTWEANHE